MSFKQFKRFVSHTFSSNVFRLTTFVRYDGPGKYTKWVDGIN